MSLKTLKVEIAFKHLPEEYSSYYVDIYRYFHEHNVYEHIYKSNVVQLTNPHTLLDSNAKLDLKESDNTIKFEIFGQKKTGETAMVGYVLTNRNDLSKNESSLMIFKAQSEEYLAGQNENSKLILRAMERDDERISVKFKAVDVSVKGGYSYFIILRKDSNRWTGIYKSEPAEHKRGIDAKWKTFSVKLKPDRKDAKLMLRLFQSSFMNPKIIGEIRFTKDDLIVGKRMTIYKSASKAGNKKFERGTIEVLKVGPRTTDCSNNGSMTNTAKEGETKPLKPIVTYPFEDYLKSGVVVTSFFGVDFSLDNQIGEFQMHGDGKENMYIPAITTFKKVAMETTSGLNSHVWGFNGKLKNSTSDCFLLSFDSKKKTQKSLEEILSVYNDGRKKVAFSSIKTLSGILKTSKMVIQSIANQRETYFTLFVFVANGDFEDYKQQWDLYSELAHDPISIFIIGVGPGNFNRFRDFIYTLKLDRKNVQFIHYSEKLRRQPNDVILIQDIKTILQKQITEYYGIHNISPGDIALSVQMKTQPSLQFATPSASFSYNSAPPQSEPYQNLRQSVPNHMMMNDPINNINHPNQNMNQNQNQNQNQLGDPNLFRQTRPSFSSAQTMPMARMGGGYGLGASHQNNYADMSQKSAPTNAGFSNRMGQDFGAKNRS